MARASPAPPGLPRACPSSTTTVSAPSTTPSPTRPATARALRAARRATASDVGPASSVSSISLGTTSNSRTIVASSSRRRGEPDARISLIARYRAAGGGLELAKRDRRDHDPDDADQVDLEAQPEGDGEEAEVERRGRRQTDRRSPGEQVVNPTRRQEAPDELAQQGADHEAGWDHQQDQHAAALARPPAGPPGHDQRMR